jgi:hypothetical protein
MNRYILIHRLTGPAILLLLGVVALLHQANLVRFSIFVPLLLILIGLIKLAERAALAAEPPQGPYAGGGYPPPGTYQGSPYPGTQYPGTIVPPTAAPTHDFGNDPEGGK